MWLDLGPFELQTEGERRPKAVYAGSGVAAIVAARLLVNLVIPTNEAGS